MRVAFPFLFVGMAFFLFPCRSTGQPPPGTAKTDAHGDPLPLGAVARIGTMKYRVADRDSARLSPDGKLLAVPGLPGEVNVWELPAWNNRRVLRLAAAEKEMPADLTGLRFSSGGKTLAAFDATNQRIAFFDLASAKCIKLFKLPLKTQLSHLDVVIASDQQTFVATGSDRNQTHCFLGQMAGDRITLASSVPDRSNLAVSSDCRWCAHHCNGIELRDLTTGKTVWKARYDSKHARLAFSPDRKLLVVADETSVRLLDAATGKEQLNQRRPSSWVYDVEFAPDGKMFHLWGSRNHEITIWDAATGKQTASHASPTMEYVSQVVFTPQGKMLALAQTHRNTLSVWDVLTGKMTSPTDAPEYWSRRIFFSSSGELHVGSGWNAAWWNPRTGAKLRDCSQDLYTMLDAHFSYRDDPVLFEDGTKTASLSGDTIRIWNTGTGRDSARLVFPLKGEERVWHFAVAPTSRYCAVGIFEGDYVIDLTGKPAAEIPSRLLVWDQEKKAVVRTCNKPHPDKRAVFSADGRWLAYVDKDGRAHVGRVDEPAKELLKIDKLADKVECLALSPDGRQLACAVEVGERRKIYLCDTVSGNVNRVLHADDSCWVGDLSYSPDGTMLAGAANYTTVLVWETGIRCVAGPIKSEPAAAQPARAEPRLPPRTQTVFNEPLPPGALMRIGTTRFRMEEKIDRQPGRRPADIRYIAARLSPDARFVAALSGQGTIDTWELPGWTSGRSLRPNTAPKETTAHYAIFRCGEGTAQRERSN